MRIKVIRARDCCGASYGLGIVMSHWDIRSGRSGAFRILLWWWHIVIVFRQPPQ